MCACTCERPASLAPNPNPDPDPGPGPGSVQWRQHVRGAPLMAVRIRAAKMAHLATTHPVHQNSPARHDASTSGSDAAMLHSFSALLETTAAIQATQLPPASPEAGSDSDLDADLDADPDTEDPDSFCASTRSTLETVTLRMKTAEPDEALAEVSRGARARARTFTHAPMQPLPPLPQK